MDTGALCAEAHRWLVLDLRRRVQGDARGKTRPRQQAGPESLRQCVLHLPPARNQYPRLPPVPRPRVNAPQLPPVPVPMSVDLLIVTNKQLVFF